MNTPIRRAAVLAASALVGTMTTILPAAATTAVSRDQAAVSATATPGVVTPGVAAADPPLGFTDIRACPLRRIRRGSESLCVGESAEAFVSGTVTCPAAGDVEVRFEDLDITGGVDVTRFGHLSFTGRCDPASGLLFGESFLDERFNRPLSPVGLRGFRDFRSGDRVRLVVIQLSSGTSAAKEFRLPGSYELV